MATTIKRDAAKRRLKTVAMEDKVSAIESMLRVLRSDQYKLLTN